MTQKNNRGFIFFGIILYFSILGSAINVYGFLWWENVIFAGILTLSILGFIEISNQTNKKVTKT